MLRKKITAAVVLLLALATVRGSIHSTQEKRGRPIKGFPESSLTIFPVRHTITGPLEKHRMFVDALKRKFAEEARGLADTLGLLLEEKGYDKHELTNTDYQFSEGEEVRKDRATDFGKFVGDLDLKTDYALYTEFTFHLQRSCQEVYTVIVDTTGNVVWEDRQKPGDVEFDKDLPGTSQKCCELVRKRLVPAMGLDGLPERELADDKKQALEKIRAEEPPSKSEFAAMGKRVEAMKVADGSARVIVYPTRVGGDRTDQASATRLAELLDDAGLCQASVAETGPVLEGEGWPNEMKVLWLYARAARQYAREHTVDSDYVLFADYWLRPRDKGVHAVHFVICDRAGEWLIVDMQNSHQGDFQRIDPKTLEDCDRLVVERLKWHLR